MTLDLLELLNSGLGFIALLLAVLVACTATYVILQRRLKKEIGAMRAEIDRSIDVRSASTVAGPTKAGGARSVTEAKPSNTDLDISNPVATAKPDAKSAAPQPQQTAEELAHETLVVIAAAVSAFLGKSVRLRSARLIHPLEGNAWAQQGRVFVQASHNLGIAHHG